RRRSSPPPSHGTPKAHRAARGRGPWAEAPGPRTGGVAVVPHVCGGAEGSGRAGRAPCSPAPARRRLGLPPALVALSACRLSPAVRRLPTRRPLRPLTVVLVLSGCRPPPQEALEHPPATG